MQVSMPIVAAAYSTRVRYLTTTGGTWEQICDRNPLRLHLRVENAGPGIGVVFVVPAGGQDSPVAIGSSNTPYETEYHKRPAAITGEWWIFSTGAVPICITEETQNPV